MKFIAISGISGAGKTTVGKELQKRLTAKGYPTVHIDQDAYYRKDKPKIMLSTGVVRSNWDSLEALDSDRMNDDIDRLLTGTESFLIVTGFALRDDVLRHRPDLHIHLEIPLEESWKTRILVKGFRDSDLKNQTAMFEESVKPFYEETVERSSFDVEYPVVVDGKRIDMDLELEVLEAYIMSA